MKRRGISVRLAELRDDVADFLRRRAAEADLGTIVAHRTVDQWVAASVGQPTCADALRLDQTDVPTATWFDHTFRHSLAAPMLEMQECAMDGDLPGIVNWTWGLSLMR